MHLLVLDVGAQPEQVAKLAVVDDDAAVGGVGAAAGAGALCGDKGAADVELREVGVRRRRVVARDGRGRVDDHVLGNLAVVHRADELLERHRGRLGGRLLLIGVALEGLLERAALGVEDGADLGVLDDNLEDLGEPVRLGLLEDRVLEQRVEAAGHRLVDDGVSVGRLEGAHRAVLGVGARQRDHAEDLEELVQLEAAVALLDGPTPHHARRLLAVHGVVDLVGALKERDEARVRKLRVAQLAVEGGHQVKVITALLLTTYLITDY